MAHDSEDEYHSAEDIISNEDTMDRTASLPEVSSLKGTYLFPEPVEDLASAGESELERNEDHSENTAEETANIEYIQRIDNKYVSDGADDVNTGKVELTDEQVKEIKLQGSKIKASGNEAFKSNRIHEAIELYTEAIHIFPSEYCSEELSICHANRAACYMKLENHDEVVQDCTKALELKPDYLKALIRRAQSNEALEKLDEALEDYKKALELDPTQMTARHAVMRLPEQIKEQQEKMKAEMMGKLKELGDAVLKPFGLSTSNFQLQQDPSSGGYSINFKR